MIAPKKTFRHFLTLLISLLFVCTCIYVVWDNTDRIRELVLIPVGSLLLASAMFIINIIIRASFNWSLFRQHGNNVPFPTYIALYLFTTGLSSFIPASGSIYSARYLKNHHDVNTGDFVRIFVGFNLLLALSGSIMGAGLVGVAWQVSGNFYVEVFCIFLLTVFGIFLLKSTWLRNAIGMPARLAFAQQAFDGIRSLLGSYKMIFLSALTITGLITTTFIAIWTLSAGAELDVNPIQLLMIVLSQVLSGLVPLSPGGIGLQEAAAVIFGAAMNIGLIDLFLIFVLWRVLRMLVIIILLIPTRFYINRKSGDA